MSKDPTEPDFGPGGYLPPKASKRARKIVLREQMGWGWPVAAVLASLLVLVAGGAYLYASTRAPDAPFVALQPVTAVPAGGAAVLTSDDARVAALVVRAGGPVRAYRAEGDDVRWCPQSRRLEGDGAAWTPDGRRVFGQAPSLEPLRSVVHNGVVYADFSNPLPRPKPSEGEQPPVCL